MFTDFEWIEWRQCEFPRCTHHDRAIVEITKVNNDTRVFQEGDIVHIEAGVDLARDDWMAMVVGADLCLPDTQSPKVDAQVRGKPDHDNPYPNESTGRTAQATFADRADKVRELQKEGE